MSYFAGMNSRARARKPVIGEGQPKQRKQVFGTHANLAHIWAQQTFGYGRSADGRMFFEDATLYSYGRHYAIATFTDATLNGRRVILFNSDKYSHSTAAHMREAEHALRGLSVVTMHVPNVGTSSWDHERNLRDMLDGLASRATEYAKPRKRIYLGWNASGSDSIEDTCENRCAALDASRIADYCRAFDLPMPDVGLDAKRDAIRKAFADHNDPKAAAKRKRDAAKRLVIKARENADLMARFYAVIEGVAPFQHFVTSEIKTIRALARLGDYPRYSAMVSDEWRKQYASNRGEDITPEQWQDGLGHANSLPYNCTSTLCRRKDNRLETSRGAEVPWQHAVAVFYRAQACRRNAKPWQRNGEQHAIGHYQLDSVDAAGNIKAGCHTIAWDEMLRLAVREMPESVLPTYPVPAIIA